jgi:hypothetical protein
MPLLTLRAKLQMNSSPEIKQILLQLGCLMILGHPEKPRLDRKERTY